MILTGPTGGKGPKRRPGYWPSVQGCGRLAGRSCGGNADADAWAFNGDDCCPLETSQRNRTIGPGVAASPSRRNSHPSDNRHRYGDAGYLSRRATRFTTSR